MPCFSCFSQKLTVRSYLIVGVKKTLSYFITAACYILPLARSVQIKYAYSISVISRRRIHHKDHQVRISRNTLKLSGTEDSTCNTIISFYPSRTHLVSICTSIDWTEVLTMRSYLFMILKPRRTWPDTHLFIFSQLMTCVVLPSMFCKINSLLHLHASYLI